MIFILSLLLFFFFVCWFALRTILFASRIWRNGIIIIVQFRLFVRFCCCIVSLPFFPLWLSHVVCLLLCTNRSGHISFSLSYTLQVLVVLFHSILPFYICFLFSVYSFCCCCWFFFTLKFLYWIELTSLIFK